MSDYYILDENKEPVPTNHMTWAMWLQRNRTNRHVADNHIGDVRVSTVFLGLNHQFGDGPPLLYETLVFGGNLDGEIARYSTREQAAAGHLVMMEKVRQRG